MRRTLLLIAAAASIVGAAAASGLDASEAARASPESPMPALGIEQRSGGVAWLSRYDPVTLKQVTARRLRLAGHTGSWSFAPDRRSLAIGSARDASIRIVDPASLRVRRDVPLADAAGSVSWVTWLRSHRMLAVAKRGNAAVYVVAVDPRSRRVLRWTTVDAVPWQGVRLREGLVLLLGSADGIRPAQLAVVDVDGVVRLATIPRISIGVDASPRGHDPIFRRQGPGLAVDPESRRAFLVDGDDLVAAVDLDSLAVSYHRASRARRVPAAIRKAVDGPYRQAQWLGRGTLVVSGVDSTAWKDTAGKVQWRAAAAGLSLVDTRTWRRRAIDPDASSFRAATDLLLASGGSSGSAAQERRDVGVAAYGLDGSPGWRLFEGESAYVEQLAGPYAYVVTEGSRLAVVELATGQVVALHPRPRTGWWPSLVTGTASENR
jgi:hypothetical protein